MTIEEFLTTVQEQLRCKKAREPIARELEGHIMDQAASYEKDGMDKEAALNKAVCEMGDPVAIGVDLDRVHRPKISRSILALAGVLGIFSIVLHVALSGYYEEPYYANRQACYVVFGYLLMLIVYHVDYSFLGKWSRLAAGVFFVLMLFLSSAIGTSEFGKMVPTSGSFSLSTLSWLFLPIYGGLLYAYRGEGKSVLWKMALWTAAPLLFLKLFNPRFSISLTVILGLSLIALFSIAVAKGWYRVNKTAVLCTVWGMVLVLPALMAGLAKAGGTMPNYQIARIKAFLNPEDYEKTTAYAAVWAKQILHDSQFVGSDSLNMENVVHCLVDSTNNYVLVSIIAIFGMAAGALVIGLLAGMIGRIFNISLGQKNQLGMIVGCSCGMAFLMQTLLSVLVNLNLVPIATNTLPFFCFGGSCTLVTYVLLGLVLSIYRYKDIPCTSAAEARAVEHA